MYLPLAPALLASAAPVAMAQPAAIAEQQVALPDAVTAPPAAAPAASSTEAVPPADAEAPEAPPEELPDGDVIIVEGTVVPQQNDPLDRVNEAAFQITQRVDEAIVGPVAEVYGEDIPKPLRNGLRNFLRNLMEPINALNFLLQLKPGKAIETLGRFAINTTVGIAGLVDVAEEEPFNLPYRRNGFANTLGYYGVGPGPYLVLPLIGATTLRDLLGTTIDQSILPLAVGSPLNTPYYAVPAYTINSLQFRMEFDERLEDIRATDDPYLAMRESYLCLREADIAALRNRPPPRDCSIAALMAPYGGGGADDEDYEDEISAAPAEPAMETAPAAPVEEAPEASETAELAPQG